MNGFLSRASSSSRWYLFSGFRWHQSVIIAVDISRTMPFLELMIWGRTNCPTITAKRASRSVHPVASLSYFPFGTAHHSSSPLRKNRGAYSDATSTFFSLLLKDMLLLAMTCLCSRSPVINSFPKNTHGRPVDQLGSHSDLIMACIKEVSHPAFLSAARVVLCSSKE